MSLFAGETTVVWHTADNLDTGDPLTSADVVSVTAIFFDHTGLEVGRNVMPWVESRTGLDGTVVPARWELVWATAGLPPGRYRVQCRIEGIDGTVNWEFLTIRLNRNLVGG